MPVRFESVSFAYPARPVPVLDGLDLELAPGEAVALVGESGAGKSTVAALLLGLLEPESGRISVGGVDLSSCDIEAWRRLVAWVPQHPTLLRATVAENIRLGDPDASDAQVREAAALAGAHAFITAAAAGLRDARRRRGAIALAGGAAARSGLPARFCATRRS